MAQTEPGQTVGKDAGAPKSQVTRRKEKSELIPRISPRA